MLIKRRFPTCSDDADGNVIADAVRVAAYEPLSQTVDNAHAAYGELAGTWQTGTLEGAYGDNYRVCMAGDGRADFQFERLVTGHAYEVWTTWLPHEGRASDAPYTLLWEGGGQRTVEVNQRLAPDDVSFDGSQWKRLGTYEALSDELRVELGNGTDGYVVADAVRVVEVSLESHAPVDDGDVDYSEVGAGWESGALEGGHGDDYRFHAAGDGSGRAQWQFADALPGHRYHVLVTWLEYPGRATNAPFTVSSGGDVLATVRVDQRVAPDGQMYAGTAWQVLGAFDVGVQGGLTVELGDDADGFVIADAVRLVEALSPPGSVDDGDAAFDVAGAAWTEHTSATSVGGDYRGREADGAPSAASWTFDSLRRDRAYRVLVTWSADASLADDAMYSVYEGDDLAYRLQVDQQQAPSGYTLGGKSWQSLGTVSGEDGRVVVALSDQAGGPVVADAVQLIELSPAAQIVDNADPAYSEAGSGWATGTLAGAYGDDYRYRPAGSGSRTADWRFDGLLPGRAYQVFVTWVPYAGRASNAPYSVLDGATVLATERVDQRVAPDDVTAAGVAWESLGVYVPDGRSLTVRLSDDADGNVIADAVRVVEVAAPAEVVDWGLPGYSEQGDPWRTGSLVGGYGNEYRYVVGPGGDAQNALWTFDGLIRGTSYELYATWPPHADGRATSVTYRVLDGATLLDTVVVDQRAVAAGAVFEQYDWQHLGSFQSDTGTLTLELSDNSTGNIIADAAWLVPSASALTLHGPTAAILGQTVSLRVEVLAPLHADFDTVTFYHDADGDGRLGAGDTLLGADSNGGDGFSFDVATTGLADGDTLFFAETVRPNGLAQAVSLPVRLSADTAVVDDRDAATFATFGPGWTDGVFHASEAYANGYQTTQRTGAANTAEWTFSDLDASVYAVLVGHVAGPNHATAAPFHVFDGDTASGANELSRTVDQTLAPNDYAYLGRSWEVLGDVYLDSGTLTVQLDASAATGDWLVADAVCIVRPGRIIAFDAPTMVMTGMAISLQADVVDPTGNAVEQVEFYRDVDGDGVLDLQVDQFLHADTDGSDGWTHAIDSGYLAAGDYTYFARVTVDGAVVDQATAQSRVHGTMAILDDGQSGYAESGDGWETVIDPNAYGGSYRQTSTAGDYATYTFTGLAPGNYEFWVQYASGDQHPTSVPLQVYDGDVATGRLQHTFAVKERNALSTNNWGVRNYDGYDWGWVYTGVAEETVGTVYSNTGTITVRLPYAGANTQSPTLWLMAAPASLGPYRAGGTGGREVSSDPVEYATGEASMCFCDSTLSAKSVPVYSNIDALAISAYGYGQQSGLAMRGNGMFLTVENQGDLCDPPSVFVDPQRFYVPLYGTQDTLVDHSTHLTLTKPNGAVVQFVAPVEDGETYASGPWQATIRANGQIRQVVSWLGNAIDGRPLEIQDAVSATAQPYASELYSYVATGPNAGLVESITYRQWDDVADDWANVYRAEYTYYVTGEGADSGGNFHGLSGDLKTVTTRYWDGGQWAGGDTYYYRYYTEPTFDGQQNFIGFAHGRRREVLPNAYNGLSAYAAGLGKTPDELLDSEMAAYTCFYYEYDAFRRVTSETVFGGLRTTTFAYTEGSNAVLNGDGTINAAVWTRKTVENRPDGSTYTVYTNYLGQTLLSDLADPSENHTYTYYEYDLDGRPILTAGASAIDAYDDGANDDFRISLTVTGAGPVEQTTYYATTTATAETAGGAAGYVATRSIAEGLVAPTGGATSYWNTEMVLQQSYEYFKYTANNPSGSQATVYPVASVTRYADEAGTTPVTTSYAYTWHEGSVQRKTVVTTLPAVSGAQNGSGQAAQQVAFYDEAGNLTWSKDERGFLTRYVVDSLTGRMIQSIDDADTTGLANLPVDPTTGNPLATPAGGGRNLVSDYSHDPHGRTTQVLGPVHLVDGVATRTAQWTVYDDAAGETRSAVGYAVESTPGSGTFDSFTIVGPVGITRYDADGRVLEQIEATPEVTTTADPLASLAAETFSLDEYTAWTAYQYRKTQLVATAGYYAIPAVASDPDADGFTGVRGTHYDVHAYGYDSVGRSARVVSPGGTVSQAFFDARGLVLETWLGTDDVPDADHNGDGTIDSGDFRWYVENHGAAPAGTNMVLVSQNEYDHGQAGDGLLTKVTEHVDDSTTRTVEYGYDWRNRQVWSYQDDGTYGTYSYLTHDNLGRVTRSEQYWDADEDFAAQGPELATDDILIARSETAYDDRGRVYESTRYAVDPSDGSVGDALTDRFWYDAAGNVIKSQSAGTEQFAKTAYDGLGQVVAQYVGFDTDETTYAEAGNVDGDTVFAQTEYDYNGAGQTIFVTTRDRLHDATGTGALSGPAGVQPKSRDSYMATWYDGLGRQTAVANYGTAGGTVMDIGDRPDAAPARSDTVLVTSYEYNPAGRLYKVIDPAGRDDRTYYDALGRVVRTIANYTDGDPATGGSDQDVTVETTYTPDGQIATYTAVNPATGDQVTRYVYGTTLADSGVARSDLLRAVIYPDSDDTGATGVPPVLGDGIDGVYDRVEYKYNRLGHVIWTKDQNETVHEYAFDGVGRQTADRVTLPQGSEIDDSVLRIEHGYEVRGMVASITSFDATTGGNAVNQVLREYDDWGLLDKEYQEHAGEVDASTLYVQYNYADASAGLRLESVRYPNGRLVHYTYGTAGSDADHLNRLDAIRDDDGGVPGDVLAQYTYLGLGTVVVEDYVEPQVKLDLWGGTSGEYQGFDRFGRIVDHLWRDYGSSADADRFLYGYDRAGNRIWKENDVSANLGMPLHLDELYEYDGLYRLINTQRGNLNANRDAITDKAFEQDWGLDATGNWEGFNQDDDGDGTNDLEQTREHNEANEVTSASDWASSAHDRVGNMTSMPKPASPADALGAKYDAWNRLVEVSEGGILIARFSYDGAGRRILKQLADAMEPDQYIHLFHSGQQVVETREGDDSAGVPDPTELPPRHQFVWSPRYVDGLILRDEYDAQGQLVAGERLFYLADANFNVTALVGLVETEPDVFEWQVVERYVYSPYGAVTIYAPDWSATRAESAFDNTTLYTGREFDSETGLYYYRARYYHAELGQFISRDPIGYEAGDVNLYRYVGNRPVVFVDPNGHEIFLPGPDAWNDYYGLPPVYRPSWPLTHPMDLHIPSKPIPLLPLPDDDYVWWRQRCLEGDIVSPHLLQPRQPRDPVEDFVGKVGVPLLRQILPPAPPRRDPDLPYNPNDGGVDLIPKQPPKPLIMTPVPGLPGGRIGFGADGQGFGAWLDLKRGGQQQRRCPPR